jgi:signal-transduction protein with cAMP-binding, CBS, and nucleotidyltransferase domain
MKLLEFFYFNDKNNNYTIDRRYESSNDLSVLDQEDTRKIRLTFKQINMLRMQSEAHEAEQESELGFIRQMYGQPPAEQPQ